MVRIKYVHRVHYDVIEYIEDYILGNNHNQQELEANILVYVNAYSVAKTLYKSGEDYKLAQKQFEAVKLSFAYYLDRIEVGYHERLDIFKYLRKEVDNAK